jgi:hypothetical protein
VETRRAGLNSRHQQGVYDSLIRVDGSGDLRQANVGVFGAVQSRSQLFVRQGADVAITNLTTGGFFPSDQTFVTLAVRVWTYFRFNYESSRTSPPPASLTDAVSVLPGVTGDRVARVHKLYHQAENQLFWQFVAGDKPQLTTFTAYTPFAGGLDGFFNDSRLYRANNGVPTSSALMRLARPILVPPRQGFQVVAIASPIGQAQGASILEQFNGLVPQNDPWGAATTGGTITGTVNALSSLPTTGRDDIEKDVFSHETWRPIRSNADDSNVVKTREPLGDDQDNAVASACRNAGAAVESGAEGQNGLKLASEERSSLVSHTPDRVMARVKTRSDLHGDVQTAAEMTAVGHTVHKRTSHNKGPSTSSTGSTRVLPLGNQRVTDRANSVNISPERDNTEPSVIGNDDEGVETAAEYQTGMTPPSRARALDGNPAPYRHFVAREMRQSALHGDMQIAGETAAALASSKRVVTSSHSRDVL